MNWMTRRLLLEPFVRNAPDGSAGATPASPGATPAPVTAVHQPAGEAGSAISTGTTDSAPGGTPAAGASSAPGEAGVRAGESAAPAPAEATSALDQGADFNEDDTPKEPAAAAAEALTVEALELGEDHGYDPETLNEFLGFMNDPELDSAGRAKAMLGLADKLLVNTFTQVQAQAVEQWTSTQNEWRGKIRQLKGFGDNTPQRLGEIKRGLMAAGADKETFAALNVTGAGNHPAIVKLLDKLAKPFLEKSVPSGGTVREGKSLEDKFSKLFPSTQSKD